MGTNLHVLVRRRSDRRGHCRVRWSRREQMVWQELTMLARSFGSEPFDGMIRLFTIACADARPDLVDRVYGQAAQ